MAGDSEDRGLTEISRCGDLWLVVRGGLGRTYSEARGKVSRPAPVGSIMAHVHTNAPWEPAELSEAPEAVRKAAECDEGWEPPEWTGR